MQESLKDLQQQIPSTFKEYEASKNLQHILERLFQLVVDSAVDINTGLLEKKGIHKADTYFGTFTAMSEAGLLPSELTSRIAQSVGLRNALIHRYETIDKERAYKGLKKFTELYQEYLSIVEKLI